MPISAISTNTSQTFFIVLTIVPNIPYPLSRQLENYIAELIIKITQNQVFQ